MKLKVGDRIRIIGIPGEGMEDYVIQPETIRAYKFLIKRGRSVRISEIDEYGLPWFHFIIKKKGKLEHHSMNIMEGDMNWVMVKSRDKNGPYTTKTDG